MSEYPVALPTLDSLLLQVLDMLDEGNDEKVSLEELKAHYPEGSLVATQAISLGMTQLGPVEMVQLTLEESRVVGTFVAIGRSGNGNITPGEMA